MKFFDTHAHIGLIYEDPIQELITIREAKQEKVEHIISICNSLHDFATVYENLRTATGIYHGVGISPSEVVHQGRNWESKIIEYAKLERVVAIGETGLDYYKKFGDKDSQIALFIRQLELAQQLDLPVIIHNREAGKDVLEILQHKLPRKGGVLHCFSEGWDFAKKALDMNMFISFAGNVTYKNARNLHETAMKMPLENMVIESEAPFMVPAEYKGKRNMPAYIHSTLEFLADMRGMDPEELADILYSNSLRLFNIKE
ncbi:MAG: TatD family hydrolase [Spirochaetia bacterium]|nr:TatD family hydrolase [Spirochaetia bacterium]